MNLRIIKAIWYDITIDEHRAVIEVAREFNRSQHECPVARKFTAYLNGASYEPLALMKELADQYSL